MTQDELRAAGFVVDEAGYARLAGFVRTLLEENSRLNLTAARNEAAVWGHVCDSLALRAALSGGERRRLLDLGSGGGLPGIPLACVDEQLEVTLLDATRKKVEAVGRIIARLELANARVVCGRAEVVAHEPAQREHYDFVTARAVASLALLVEYAAGFVQVGGECWFYKTSASIKAEQRAAEAALRQCGLQPAGERAYRLPGEAEDRLLVGYRKTRRLATELPRAPGRAKKRPL